MGLSDLEQRLAVAIERNRVNIANRDRYLAEARTEFGVGSLEELRVLQNAELELVEKLRANEATAMAKAEEAVSAVEEAVGSAQ